MQQSAAVTLGQANLKKLFALKLINESAFLDTKCLACKILQEKSVAVHDCPLRLGTCYACGLRTRQHSSFNCTMKKQYPAGICFFCGLPKTIANVDIHSDENFGNKTCPYRQVPEILLFLWRMDKIPVPAVSVNDEKTAFKYLLLSSNRNGILNGYDFIINKLNNL